MDNTAIALISVYLAIVIAAVTGWAMNIFTIFSSFDALSTGEAIIRTAGIFIPFIGAVAGYF